MKITSTLALTGFFSQFLISGFSSPASATSLFFGAEKVKQVVAEAKESVLVFGQSDESAYQHLTQNIISEKINSSDVTAYIAEYGSIDEQTVFNEAMSLHQMNSEQISRIILTVGTKHVKNGANFKVSCGLGLGIGIPLALAGAILIIASLGQEQKKHETQANYQNDEQKTTTVYLANSGQLKTQQSQYNSLIDVSQSQANELNRKISSGYYSDTEVASFKTQLTQLNTDIANYKVDIGNVAANIAYTQAEYDRAMSKYSDAESKSLSSLNRNVAIEGSSGVVAALVGIPLIFVGASDCQ